MSDTAASLSDEEVVVMTSTTDLPIDMKRERYPFCVVWTPIPLITYACFTPCPVFRVSHTLREPPRIPLL